MQALLIALLMALVVGINLNFKDLRRTPANFFKRWAVVSGILVLPFWGLTYLVNPSLAGPLFGVMIPSCIAVGFGIRMVLGTLSEFQVASVYASRVSWGLAVLAIVIPISLLVYSTPLFHAKALAEMVQSVESVDFERGFDRIKPDHILQVPKEQAEWRGSQVLGEGGGKIGSMFTPTSYTIQKVGNELVWVAPLDYLGFRHWTGGEYPPGYVVVSAQDPNREAHLHTAWGKNKNTMALRFTRNAFFGDNLERHLWTSGYKWYDLQDFTFELDDEWRPWWVVTLTKPTMGYTGDKVVGALIIDPESGAIEEYLGDEGLKKLPSWVDRIIPEGMISQYLYWWGTYRQGFWNGVWYKHDVAEPTVVHQSLLPSTEDQTLNMVWGSDGEPYWFTGMRSANGRNNSLFSFMLVHTKSGKVQEYKVSGTDEAGVMTAVNNKVAFKHQHAAYPVLYNLYGTTVWTVPIMGQNHTFQGMALVQIENAEVVVGSTLNEAIQQTQQLLASQISMSIRSTAPLSKATFVVTRMVETVSGGNGVFFFWGEAEEVNSKVFTATKDTSVEVPLTLPGDEVEVEFMDTGNSMVPIRAFNNKRIPIHDLSAYDRVK